MTDQPTPPAGGEPEPDPHRAADRPDPPPAAGGNAQGGGGGSGANPADQPHVQQYQHQAPVTARVTDRVTRGVYTTGQLILDSPKEFVVDFFQGLTRPYQVVARVVMHPATVAEFAAALRQNLENYRRTFGPPPQLPPPGPNRPTLQEIYDNFKLPDDHLSGAYANAVLIGHSVTEVYMDFITTFYPTSAVSARVYMSAAAAPRFLTSLDTALAEYQKRWQQPPPAQQPPADG